MGYGYGGRVDVRVSMNMVREGRCEVGYGCGEEG